MYQIVVAAFLVVIVAMQLTTSSIGIFSPSGASDNSVVAGHPQPIRSDEYLRGSPRDIGLLRNNGDVAALTPFEVATQSSQHSLPRRVGKVVSQIAEPEKTLGKALLTKAPVDTRFAFIMDVDSALLFAFLPFMLFLLGVRLGSGVSITALVWLSAPVQWWSLNPVALMAPAAASAALILAGAHLLIPASVSRWRWALATGIVIFGGLRVPTLAVGYTPWSIIVFAVFACITIGGVLAFSLTRRQKAIVLGTGSVTALVSGGLLIWANSATFSTIAATVYPGSRRSTGVASIPIWSGTSVGDLARRGPELVSSNQSELAVGLLILLPIAAAAAIGSWRRRRISASALSLALGLGAAGVFLSWTLMRWPDALLTVNPITLIAPDRAAQILGPLALVLYGLSLAAFPMHGRIARRRLVLSAGMILGLYLSIQGGLDLQHAFLPTLPSQTIVATSIVVVAAAALPFATRFRSLALVPLVLISLYAAREINPIQQGTGALTSSPLATSINEAASSSRGRWASDNIFTDALILASGAPQLSGQQFGGPDYSTWNTLDPEQTQKSAWNRGASYVTFDWNDLLVPTIDNPTPDIIRINVSPCAPSMADLDLRWILTPVTPDPDCTTLVSTGTWQGIPVNIYRVDTPR